MKVIQSLMENLKENELKNIKMTLGNNENFVIRYDSIPESSSSQVRTTLRIILKERFPLHYSFLKELNEYYNKYNEGILKENSKEWKSNGRIRKRFLKLYKNFTRSDAELLIENMNSINKIRGLLSSEFISDIDNAKAKKDKIKKKIKAIENAQNNDLNEEKKLDSDEEGENDHILQKDSAENIINPNDDDIDYKLKELYAEKDQIERKKIGKH